MPRAVEGGASVSEAFDAALWWGVRHPDRDLFEHLPYPGREPGEDDGDDGDDTLGQPHAGEVKAETNAVGGPSRDGASSSPERWAESSQGPSPVSAGLLQAPDAPNSSRGQGKGPLMIFALSYQSLSTFVTPAARAVTQPPITDPAEQRWVFGLSGVVLVDFTGTSNAVWRHDQLLVSPNLGSALFPALNRYSIPTPPGTPGKDWAPWIQVEDSLPFAGLSSIFDAHESINAGFAVDGWTLQTRPGTEAGTGANIRACSAVWSRTWPCATTTPSCTG